MRKSSSFRTIMIFLVPFFLLLIITSQSNAAERTITLKLTSQLAPEHFISRTLDEWAKDLEKRTAGRVKVINFHAATLAPANQQFDAAAKGITDLCNHVLGNTMGRFPLSEVLDLPVGFPDSKVYTKITNQFYQKFKPKEFDSVKVLWLHAQGPGFVCMKSKPVRKLEDLKGLKIRTFGGNVKFMAALGGSPVAMPMPEVYEALSKGIVDGMLSSYETLESRRTGEHIKYVTENKKTTYSATFVVAMNKRKWNSLPADIQKIMDKMSEEYSQKCGEAWDQGDISGRKFLEKMGGKSIALSKEEEQRWVEKGAKPVFDDYVQRMKTKRLPGEEALKFVLESLKK